MKRPVFHILRLPIGAIVIDECFYPENDDADKLYASTGIDECTTHRFKPS